MSVTGKELQNYLKTMYGNVANLEVEDYAVLRIVMDEIAKEGKFDCKDYEITEGVMHYPKIQDADQSLVATVEWCTIPFLLRKKE